MIALKNYFYFLWAMTEKEIKERYKRAVFGFLWVLLNPFLQMLIMGLIFSFFIKIPNYFLFLSTGLLPWQLFSARVASGELSECYLGLKGWLETGPSLKLEIKNTSDGGRLIRQPGGEAMTPPRWEKWIEKINQKSPTFLFVAFGMGKQEKFIYDNWQKLNVKLAMEVGGAFDYLSGQVPRAPKWMQKVGLEWFYRLICQPWRLRRQLALVKFTFLVLKEKFSSSNQILVLF